MYSGHLRRITTGIQDQQDLVRDLTYTYDGATNVTSITDMVAGKVNSFTYDGFDRVGKHLVSTFDQATNATTQESLQQYTYNVLGNIITEPDAGKLSYDPTNLTRLQRLTKADGTQKNYSYDANGNMLQAGDNVVTWTSDNQPLRIENRKTGTTAQFIYDANQQRVQQITGMVGKSETTTYVNAAFEVVYNDVGVNDRITQYKHHIYADGAEVAMQVRTLKNNVKQPDELRYLHADALGNIDTITDSHGTVLQRIAYSPFGTRQVTASNDPDDQAWTDRGFTGHEHLDGLGLIHMNARLYDPEIGRFLSPDTYIQAPQNSQNYNRYSYVLNNPLKYTDPSGHFFNFIIGAIFAFVASQSDNAVIRTIGSIVGMALMGGAYGDALFLSGVHNAAAAGFVQGYFNTGRLGGAFREGIWSAISAGTADWIGHSGVISSVSGQIFAHGIAQGVISELRGGSFKSGFIGASIGKSSGLLMGDAGGAPAIALRTVTAAVFGGLAAEATGGSFEDGAVSAALTHLFNDEEFWKILRDEGTEAHKLLQNHYRALGYDVEKSSSGNGIIKGGRFDIADPRTDELWEIKRNSPNGILTGIKDLQFYTNGTGFIRGGDLPSLSVNGLFMTLTNCLACNSYTYSNLGGGLIVYDTTRPNMNESSVWQDIAQSMVHNPPPMALPFIGGAPMPLPVP